MMRRMNLGFLLCRPFCFLAAYTIFRDEHTHTLYKIENRNSIAPRARPPSSVPVEHLAVLTAAPVKP